MVGDSPDKAGTTRVSKSGPSACREDVLTITPQLPLSENPPQEEFPLFEKLFALKKNTYIQ